jgi:peptidoglycan/xylan/chitin deacetylase (PgdA/CDA1 family)
MPGYIKSRLKAAALWLTDVTAVVEFLVHGKKPKPGLTILCYHRTAEDIPKDAPCDPFNVSPGTFGKQMAAVRAIQGLKVVSAKMVAGLLQDSKDFAGSYLLITFDDGYQNNLCAAEILHQQNYSSVIFVVTDYIGKPVFDFNTFDVWCRGLPNAQPSWYKPLSVAECQELLRLGMEVQLHGHTHRPLGSLPNADLDVEIKNSKAMIQSLGAGDALALAYPYGSSRAGHFNQQVEDCLRAQGIQFAVSTDAGTNPLPELKSQAYRLRRIPVHEHDRGLLFQAKAAGYCGILPLIKAAAFRMGIWTRVPARAANHEPNLDLAP